MPPLAKLIDCWIIDNADDEGVATIPSMRELASTLSGNGESIKPMRVWRTLRTYPETWLVLIQEAIQAPEQRWLQGRIKVRRANWATYDKDKKRPIQKAIQEGEQEAIRTTKTRVVTREKLLPEGAVAPPSEYPNGVVMDVLLRWLRTSYPNYRFSKPEVFQIIHALKFDPPAKVVAHAYIAVQWRQAKNVAIALAKDFRLVAPEQEIAFHVHRAAVDLKARNDRGRSSDSRDAGDPAAKASKQDPVWVSRIGQDPTTSTGTISHSGGQGIDVQDDVGVEYGAESTAERLAGVLARARATARGDGGVGALPFFTGPGSEDPGGFVDAAGHGGHRES